MNAETKKRNVIIDCDPGIDDCLALMLALKSPELNILGITTVCGNVPASLGAKNALKILKRCGRLDIPVYVGEEKPLQREYISAQDTHGEDGLGDSGIPEVTETVPFYGAVDFLNRTLAEAEKVSVIALGPLTNIALALKKNPESWTYTEAFVSMGGSFKSFGNCSPVAEYNYWCDPHAASYVYRHLPVKIQMIGLDVTRKIVLRPDILEYISQICPEEGEFLRRITRFYFDFHWAQEQVLGCVINDPLAVAYFIDPSLCQGRDMYTDIATEGIALGQSVCDEMGIWKKEPNSHVLLKTDSVRFMKLFLERIAGAKEPQLSGILKQLYPGETLTGDLSERKGGVG